MDETGEGIADEPIAGADIPIPTEIFLEELSVKLQFNPISVYWLLEELRAEGVLCKPEELRKAIADRARWRADERRWVRQGKLPRCGWMPEDVPESPRWTALAPEREKERLRLEEKRKKVLA